MNLLTLADVAFGPLIAFLGLALALGFLVLVVLVEAVVMRLAGWGSFGRSFLDSLTVNAISAVAGFVLILVMTEGALIWLALPLSIVVEGLVFEIQGRHPRRKTWLVALSINLASYALLGLAWLLLFR